MAKLWFRNATVYTGGEQPQVFFGGVLCDGGRIISLGPDAELEKQARGVDTVDAGGRLLAPGFINAHMHLYSTLARGMALRDAPPENFNQILERLWWRLDKALTLEDLAPSADLPLCDALRSGVTALIDHHASPNAIDGSLDVLAASALRIGVRLSTCYEVSDRDGPERFRAGVAENVRFGKRASAEPLLAGMFGLHASFTLSDESLDSCAAAAREAGLPAHVHVAEAQSDAEDARRRGYRGALQRLHARGLIGPGAIAVHCVHTTEEEWKLLAEAGGFAVHNPQSNMNNAVGAAPIERMLGSGVRVGIGTDGMQADVRSDLRAAFLLGHHRTADPRTMWTEMGTLLATNNALASALFGQHLGELAPGAAADCVMFDYYPPTPLTADNFMGHLLFGLWAAPAHTVAVAGRLRLRGGRVLAVDEAALAATARERARALWARF